MKKLKDWNIKELITKNFALKILSIVIAAIIWIIIINVDNPSIRKTISNIKVELTNVETLTDKGYTYAIESGATIQIVVKGPQTVVESLSNADFTAVADMSERSADSDTVRITVKCNKEDIEKQIDIVSQKTEYMKLSIDNRVDKELKLEVNHTGKPATGYVIGDVSTSPTTITISGAETTVNKIVSASVSYDVTNMTQTVSDTVVPVFYDEDGNVVDSAMLDLSRSDVKLNIEILPTKWIPVNFKLSGTPADGYELADQTANIESVCIAGSKDALDKISSIDISADAVSIDGVSANVEFSLPLSTYLSSEYRIVSSDTVLQITAAIEKTAESKFALSYSDISITGLDAGLEAVINESSDEDVIEVSVSGGEKTVNALKATDLGAAVSLTGKKAGNYTVKITFDASDDYEVLGTYYVKVTIKNAGTEETDTSEETTTPTTDATSSAATAN